MTPRVTVLLPVYNGGERLRVAVESILDQTFDDFELLAIDDLSTDQSLEILRAYDDPRIRVLRNAKNVGQVRTLNRGLQEAAGPYVARMDQDDHARPRRLERQVEVLDAEPNVVIVGTWMNAVLPDGTMYDSLRGAIRDRAEFVAAILTHSLPLGHPTVLLRRAEVLALGGYDESVRLAEDMDLWRRVALAGGDARVVQEPLLDYLHHEGQQSRKKQAEQRSNNMLSLERFIAAVSPQIRARPLRLLFTQDPLFWREFTTRAEGRLVSREVAQLLADATRRFELSPEEGAKLDALARAAVSTAATRSWRHVGLYRAAPPLFTFAHGRYRGLARTTSLAVAAPVLRVARTLARFAMAPVWNSGIAESAKRTGRRSQTLVRLHRFLR